MSAAPPHRPASVSHRRPRGALDPHRRPAGALDPRHGSAGALDPRGRPAGALDARGIALAGLVLLGACAPLPSRPARDAEPLDPAAAPFAAPARVPVRLAALEQQSRIVVEGAGGPLELVRHGRHVRTPDGRELPALRLDAAGGLHLVEGRAYPGALVVEPHPDVGLRVTNEVALEDYVRGVVAGEVVLWSAEPAELEAQAVAARSYAVAALRRRAATVVGAYLWDSTQDQVYRGRWPAPGETVPARIVARLDAALAATRGQVLALEGRVLDARFHASCGGATAAFAHVFSEGGPGAGTARCAVCAEAAAAERATLAAAPAGRVAWRWTAPAAELERLARELELGARIVRLAPARVDSSGRWLDVELVGDAGRRSLPLRELRERLGNATLKSAGIVRTWPHPGTPIEAGFYFEGVGRGHGVGLCQIGAHGLARLGWSAARILEHYYPGATLARLEEPG